MHLYSLSHTWLNLQFFNDINAAVSYQASVIVIAVN